MIKPKKKKIIQAISKFKNKLKENKGASVTILGTGKLFLIIAIFYLIFVVTTAITLITNSRDLIEDATIKTVQENYAKLYHTSRESYSGGYRPTGTGFYESYINDETSVINNLITNDKLIFKDEKLVKQDKNKQDLYRISNIQVDVNNEPLQSDTQKFMINVDYVFEYPVFLFGKDYTINVPINVKAKHTAKY